MIRSARLVRLLALGVAACGTPLQPKAPPVEAPGASAEPAPAPPPDAGAAPRDPLAGPRGEKASLRGRGVEITLSSGRGQILEPSDLHPPSGDPALIAVLPSALLYLDDGTLLVGVSDGTVTALDGEGRRRWSLGFRGAVRGLAAAGREGGDPRTPGDGLFVVTTEAGVVALVTGDGRLRWERQVSADVLSPAVTPGPPPRILAAGPRGVVALSLSGEIVFTHCTATESLAWGAAPPISLEGDTVVSGTQARFRLGDPHPPMADLTPTFPLTYRRVLGGKVTSLMAAGPGALLALVAPKKGPLDLVRIEGDRITRTPIRTDYRVDGLAQGPGGETWLLTRPVTHQEGSPPWQEGPTSVHVLEVRGGSVRERADLTKTFSDHGVAAYEPIAVAPGAPVGFFCVSHDNPACAVHDGAGFQVFKPPTTIVSVARLGAVTWAVDDKGALFQAAGRSLSPFPSPPGLSTEWLAGTGDRDVWAYARASYEIFHHDGARWREIGVPIHLDGITARAPDDAWSSNGRAHWDGTRWSLVLGMPRAEAVVVRGRDDVWVAGDGVWHGTAPGPTVVRLAEPTAVDAGPAPAPAVLPVGAPETRYTVEKARLEVTGGEPLTAAKRVAAAPDGVLWIETWDRLVEMHVSTRGAPPPPRAGKATLLRRGERLSFDRWFHPEGAGRGVLLDREEEGPIDRRDALQLLDGGKVTGEAQRLDFHDLVAVDGTPGGFTWALGSFASTSPYSTQDFRAYELAPHALVRPPSGGSFEPVTGLPSATWCDVAAAPDGGAWFAGGLSPGPTGEGILFHALGPAGAGGTSRFRARASLLAVTAAGPAEAWAVGAAGTVVHARGDGVTRLALPSGAWLRAVAAAGPDDVWIGGDDGTLLHHDGHEVRPVEHPLGTHAAFTGIAISGGSVWAVGPSGILRIRRR